MLFTITYDEELCGLSVAKKDREAIPPVREDVIFVTSQLKKDDAPTRLQTCRSFGMVRNIFCSAILTYWLC